MNKPNNREIIEQVIEEYNQGNPGLLIAAIADDAVFHVPGSHILAGDFRGKPIIIEMFQRLGQLTDGTARLNTHHILSDGDQRVVVIWTMSATRKGQQYEGVAGYIFNMNDGKIIEAIQLQDDLAAFDRFMSA